MFTNRFGNSILKLEPNKEFKTGITFNGKELYGYFFSKNNVHILKNTNLAHGIVGIKQVEFVFSFITNASQGDSIPLAYLATNGTEVTSVKANRANIEITCNGEWAAFPDRYLNVLIIYSKN